MAQIRLNINRNKTCFLKYKRLAKHLNKCINLWDNI